MVSYCNYREIRNPPRWTQFWSKTNCWTHLHYFESFDILSWSIPEDQCRRKHPIILPSHSSLGLQIILKDCLLYYTSTFLYFSLWKYYEWDTVKEKTNFAFFLQLFKHHVATGKIYYQVYCYKYKLFTYASNTSRRK